MLNEIDDAEYVETTYWSVPLPDISKDLELFLKSNIKPSSSNNNAGYLKSCSYKHVRGCHATEKFLQETTDSSHYNIRNSDGIRKSQTNSYQNSFTIVGNYTRKVDEKESKLFDASLPCCEIVFNETFSKNSLLSWLSYGVKPSTKSSSKITEFVSNFIKLLLKHGILMHDDQDQDAYLWQKTFFSSNYLESDNYVQEIKETANDPLQSHDENTVVVYRPRSRKTNKVFNDHVVYSTVLKHDNNVEQHDNNFVQTLTTSFPSHSKDKPCDSFCGDDPAGNVAVRSSPNHVDGFVLLTQADNKSTNDKNLDLPESLLTKKSHVPKCTVLALAGEISQAERLNIQPPSGTAPSEPSLQQSPPIPPPQQSPPIPPPQHSPPIPPPQQSPSIPPPPILEPLITEPNSCNSVPKIETTPCNIPPPPPALIPPPPPILPASNGVIGSQSISGIPPPPPCFVPPPPGGPTPPANAQKSFMQISNENEIKEPLKPMKPLYWTRIKLKSVLHDVTKSAWKNVELNNFNEHEFVELFCKSSVTRKTVKLKRKVLEKKHTAKLLDTKRSQAVAIFMSSLRIDVDDVKHAILMVDTSLIDIETMEGIYELRPQMGELELIQAHVNAQADVEDGKKQSLDKPEEFLYKLWEIPCCSDRIFCITFPSHFEYDMSEINKSIEVINKTCEALQKGCVLKLLGIILSVGNYLNRGNRTRGQADGFDLDILSKLRDVKANTGNSTLLSYIVTVYLQSFDEKDDLISQTSPLPSALNIMRASQVSYDDIQSDLNKIKRKLNDCERRVQVVLKKGGKDSVLPFQNFMENFLGQAFMQAKDTEQKISCSQSNFAIVVDYFSVASKKSKPVTPKEFFSLWLSFCGDFNELWSSRIRKLIEEIRKQAGDKLKEMRSTSNVVVKTRCRPQSLKSRLAGQLQPQ